MAQSPVEKSKPVQTIAPKRGLITRLLDRFRSRTETTTYQRCLAVHIHYAGPRSALSDV